MLSNHYPLAFGTEHAWIIAALVFLMGVTIRHFFNAMHARAGRPWWTWGATTAIFAVIVALSLAPAWQMPEPEDYTAVPERYAPVVASAEFEDVRNVVLGRCSMCHAAEPNWPGLAAPPGGVMLETDAQIAAQAREIYLQAGLSHAMPPANLTYMEEAERALIVRWFHGIGRQETAQAPQRAALAPPEG